MDNEKTKAQFVSKQFLLDVIADSKLPASLDDYVLSAEDEVVAPKPKAKATAKATKAAKVTKAAKATKAKAAAAVEEETVDDDDELPLPASRAKRGRLIVEEDSLEIDEPSTKRKAAQSAAAAPVAVPVAAAVVVAAVEVPKAANGGKSKAGGISPVVALVEVPFPALALKAIAGSAAPVAYNSLKMTWTKVDGTLLAFSCPELPGRPLVASFDMDHTLVAPKSGAKFPKDRNDWEWLFPEVPTMLKSLHSLGYKIVIFSNQGGISKGNQKESDITGKIADISAAINVPIQAFCATAGDKFRKPATTMWKTFVASFNGGVAVDLANSFYIGDAAGRSVGWAAKKKADFGVGDRKFACNAGLPFQTPEEFFLKHAGVPFMWRSANPSEIVTPFLSGTDAKAKAKLAALEAVLATLGKKQELIMMVGMPASGKSTFAVKHLESRGYVRANRDILGTPAKCKAAIEAAFKAGKSAVVDNTNPSASARAEYIAVAKKNGIPVRALCMETSDTLANHCNLYREKHHGVKHVPDIAYNMFRKNFALPTAAEGVIEVHQVPWIPSFDSDEDQTVFLQWTE